MEHTQPHTTTHCMYRSSMKHTNTHTLSHRLHSLHILSSICFFFFPAHSSDLTHHHTFTHMHTYRHTDSVTQIHRHTPIPSVSHQPPAILPLPVQSHTLSCSLSYKDTFTQDQTHTDTHCGRAHQVHTPCTYVHLDLITSGLTGSRSWTEVTQL